jgi:thymidylate synthase
VSLYDIKCLNGFPILTTKKVFYRQAFHETLWMFIQGSSDCTYLKDNNVTIWDEWCTSYSDKYPNGTIGNIYGTVLRSYRLDKEDPNNTIDQLQRCIDMIKNNPNSRRIVMTAFDPRFVADESLSFDENVKAGNGVLNPCHSNFIQFKVVGNKLSVYSVTRSNDFFLRKSVQHHTIRVASDYGSTCL